MGPTRQISETDMKYMVSIAATTPLWGCLAAYIATRYIDVSQWRTAMATAFALTGTISAGLIYKRWSILPKIKPETTNAAPSEVTNDKDNASSSPASVKVTKEEGQPTNNAQFSTTTNSSTSSNSTHTSVSVDVPLSVQQTARKTLTIFYQTHNTTFDSAIQPFKNELSTRLKEQNYDLKIVKVNYSSDTTATEVKVQVDKDNPDYYFYFQLIKSSLDRPGGEHAVNINDTFHSAAPNIPFYPIVFYPNKNFFASPLSSFPQTTNVCKPIAIPHNNGTYDAAATVQALALEQLQPKQNSLPESGK